MGTPLSFFQEWCKVKFRKTLNLTPKVNNNKPVIKWEIWISSLTLHFPHSYKFMISGPTEMAQNQNCALNSRWKMCFLSLVNLQFWKFPQQQQYTSISQTFLGLFGVSKFSTKSGTAAIDLYKKSVSAPVHNHCICLLKCTWIYMSFLLRKQPIV